LKPLVVSLLLLTGITAAVGAPLLVTGADDELLAALAEDWERVSVLPTGYRPTDPYPRLRELLGDESAVYLLEVGPAPTGAAVSGRVIGSGGYDRDLGTIYTTSDTASLRQAVLSLWEKVEAPPTENGSLGEEKFRPSVERISRELGEARGYGTARPRGELAPEPGRIRAAQDAYHGAVEDFLAELEARLYLSELLPERTALAVEALVRSGLYVVRSEHRSGDDSYSVEVRLKPLVIRTLTRILYRELGAGAGETQAAAAGDTPES